MLAQVASDQINQVIDKLAEKIGVAASELAPLAEETIRQVSAKGLAFMISSVVLIIPAYVFLRLARSAGRGAIQATAASKDDSGYVVGAVFSGIGAMGCLTGALSIFFHGISAWLAPIPYLLGL